MNCIHMTGESCDILTDEEFETICGEDCPGYEIDEELYE